MELLDLGRQLFKEPERIKDDWAEAMITDTDNDCLYTFERIPTSMENLESLIITKRKCNNG